MTHLALRIKKIRRQKSPGKSWRNRYRALTAVLSEPLFLPVGGHALLPRVIVIFQPDSSKATILSFLLPYS
jgi:hypothetical protein